MCNTNCCKKEEDLICAMPIPFCGCDGCCPIPCGGCFKDDGCCGCCCDCDDSCCYCKYYKLLKELRDRLDKDETKINSIESVNTRQDKEIEDKYNYILKLLFDMSNNLSNETSNRIEDVNIEEHRAIAAEDDLRAYIKRVDDREQNDHIQQKAYIDNKFEYILSNNIEGIDSFFETLQYIDQNDSEIKQTIIDKQAAEASAREAEDIRLLGFITDLQTLTSNPQTKDNNITLQYGVSNQAIAKVNGIDIHVGLNALPTHLPNPQALQFSGNSNSTFNYDGSEAKQIYIPYKTSDLTNDSNFPSDSAYVHTDNNYTTAEKNKLAGIENGAEVNQNAFSNVKIGSSTISADSKTDTLELAAGSNITLTPDAVNDKITIAVNGLGTAAVKDVPTSGDASADQVVKGNDTRLSDARTPVAHTHTKSEITDFPTNVSSFTNDAGYITSSDIPAIPAAQIQSDWNQSNTNSLDFIKNKPTLFSGDYNDLTNKPTIPSTQVNADWNATTGISSILNKPNLATVATTGSYTDLVNKPTIPAAQIQSDWAQSDNTKLDYIKNKPSWIGNTKPSYTLDDVTDGTTRKLSDYAKKTEAIGGVSINGNVLTFTSVSGSTIATITLPTYSCLWEVDSNDNTKIVAKNGKAAAANGFFDTSVS